MNNKKIHQTAWRQGWDAAQDAAACEPKSVSIDNNPYQENTAENIEWDTGYRAAWFDEFPELDNINKE